MSRPPMDRWSRAAGRVPGVAVLAAVVVAAGLLWRVIRYAMHFPIWGDEAFVAINFIARDYADMVRPLIWGQIVPLLYMWANLAISQVFGVSEYPLRLIAFVSGVAALLLFWRFAWDTLPRRAGLLTVGLLAASMYAVRHGAEVKQYSSDLLISLGLTMLTWAVWRRPQSLPRWAALITLAAIAPWSSYPSLFVGGAAGILLTWLLVRERFAPRVLLGYAIFGLVLLGSAAAMYVVIAKPHAEYADRLTEIPMWTMAFPPWSEPLKLVQWMVLIHTGMMFAYPHGGHFGGSTATFLLFIVGCVWIGRRNLPLLVLLLAPFPLTLIAATFEKYPYGGSVRTSIYLAPAICLLAGAGLHALARALIWRLAPAITGAAQRRWVLARERLASAGAVFALTGFAIGGAIGDVVRPYADKGSLRSYEAVRAIAARSTPADAWITFNADREVDYAPYLGAWRGTGGQWVFDMVRFAPCPLTFAPPPDEVAAPQGHLWLFAYRGVKVDFPEGQWAEYRAAIEQRFGPAEHERFFIKERDGVQETIEAYRFSAGRMPG